MKTGMQLTKPTPAWSFDDDVCEVFADAVVCHAALDLDAAARNVSELHGVVGTGEDRLGQVEPDLLLVHVERGDELDVADVIATEVHMHQPGNEALGRGVAVVVDALHERRRAVADTHYRDTDLAVVLTVPMAVRLAVLHVPTSSLTFIRSSIPSS